MVLELYRRFPEHVRTLILADAYAGWKGSLPAEEVRLRVEGLRADLAAGERVDPPGLFAGEPPAEFAALLVEMADASRPESLAVQTAVMAETDQRALLPAITVPTLLIWGDADARSPLTVARQFADAIPSTELRRPRGSRARQQPRAAASVRRRTPELLPRSPTASRLTARGDPPWRVSREGALASGRLLGWRSMPRVRCRRSPGSSRVSSGAVTNVDPILAEQLAYYRARAREYDKWFRREGLHDSGEERNARWRRELNRVFSALDAFAPRGDVLELAYGTGEWTIRLAESATRLVGVDAAPEMRELALAKLQDAGKSNVELRVDDLFSWQPDHDYDVVFFAFWLSHVPESHSGPVLAQRARRAPPRRPLLPRGCRTRGPRQERHSRFATARSRQRDRAQATRGRSGVSNYQALVRSRPARARSSCPRP